MESTAVVAADMPSLDVECSLLVPNVTTRFRRPIANGNGGVFYCRAQPSICCLREAFVPGQSASAKGLRLFN